MCNGLSLIIQKNVQATVNGTWIFVQTNQAYILWTTCRIIPQLKQLVQHERTSVAQKAVWMNECFKNKLTFKEFFNGNLCWSVPHELNWTLQFIWIVIYFSILICSPSHVQGLLVNIMYRCKSLNCVSDTQNEYLNTSFIHQIALRSRDLTPVPCFTHVACVISQPSAY